MKLKKKFAKSILLKHYETVINKKKSENVPGSAKSMIKVSQSTKRGFSKKALTGFEILAWNLLIYTYIPSLCKECFEMCHNLGHSNKGSPFTLSKNLKKIKLITNIG
jgi:hypothetical protein